MRRALVVEDDRDLRELLSEALEANGYEVEAVADGLEATVRAGRRRVDIVFLDLDLPRLPGNAVLRVIQDLAPLPIIVVSGRADDWQRSVLAAGATACAPKPYQLRDLLALADQVLRLDSPRLDGWPTDVGTLSQEDLDALCALSDGELDRLPFGAIGLDRDGRIAQFNAYEQSSSAHPASEVLGQRFEDIAPCTRVQEFARRVDRGLRGEPLDDVLRFVFPRYGFQSVVSVRLFRDRTRGRVWIFVSQWRAR